MRSQASLVLSLVAIHACADGVEPLDDTDELADEEQSLSGGPGTPEDAPPANSPLYYRKWDWDQLPVTKCATNPIQHDHRITLDNGRTLLVTSWMPESLYLPNKTRILELAKWADRSTKSKTPKTALSSGTNGLMSAGVNTSVQHNNWGWTDLVVVTAELVLWFDVTSAHTLTTSVSNALPNGGGGQLRGVWPIKVDGSGLLNFEDIRNTSNWAPNVFQPGTALDVRGSGVSGFITEYSADNGITYNQESDPNAYIAIHAPSASKESGSGVLYTQGFLVQAIGKFVDTRSGNDRYLVGSTDSAAGSKPGKVSSETVHRFAACDDKVYIETIWRNQETYRIGPLFSAVMVTNAYGEPNPSVRDGNLTDFQYTSSDTCIVRLREDDDQGCHTSRVDYMTYEGFEHQYRSKPSLVVAPPSMILRGRTSSTNAAATPWRLTFHPLSGIVSNSVIFAFHSTCEGGTCKMGSAHDAPLFNLKFWDGNDSRIKVSDTSALPPGFESVTSNGERRFYIAPGGKLRTRFALDFHR